MVVSSLQDITIGTAHHQQKVSPPAAVRHCKRPRVDETSNLPSEIVFGQDNIASSDDMVNPLHPANVDLDKSTFSTKESDDDSSSEGSGIEELVFEGLAPDLLQDLQSKCNRIQSERDSVNQNLLRQKTLNTDMAKQLKSEQQKLAKNREELTTAKNDADTARNQLQAERRKSIAHEEDKQRLVTELKLADIEKQKMDRRMAERIDQLEESLAMATSPPAPPGWHKSYSRRAKQVWYSNSTTRHQQWHAPTTQEVSDPEEAARRARINEEHESRRAR